MRRALVAAGGWASLVCASDAWACATCFGASDSKMAQGMNLGILTLLMVIGLVLAGVASFVISLAVRAARAANRVEPQAEGQLPRPRPVGEC